jgi:hypothetical protein
MGIMKGFLLGCLAVSSLWFASWYYFDHPLLCPPQQLIVRATPGQTL